MAHILDGDGLRTRAGWSCPGCGRCWNPDVLACHHCPDGNTGKAPDEDPEPEPVIMTSRGPAPVSMFNPFGRGVIRVPDLMTEGGLRICRITDEWEAVLPGLQCRLRSVGEQFIEFRLTPAGGSP